MKIRNESLIQGSVSWFACLVIMAPILVIMSWTVLDKQVGEAAVLTLANFKTAFGNPTVLAAIRNTIYASVGSTTLATVLGVSLAWIVTRTNVPGKRVLHVWNTIPFYLSPFVGAIAWSYLAAPRSGLLNAVAFQQFGLSGTTFNIYGIPGIIWVQGIFFTPIVYLMVSAAFSQMDPSLEESSRACGRGTMSTMLRITLPLATPSILSAVILTFVSSAGEFGVPLTLGVPRNYETLSTLIFEVIQRAKPEYGLAATMGLILAAVTIACVLLHRYVILRRNYTTITGRGYRPAVINLGRWRWAAFGFNLTFFLVAIVLPLVALLLQSFQKAWLGKFMMKQFTFTNYSEVLFFIPATLRGIENSLILSITGATIGVVIALLVAQAIYRTRLKGARWIDLITSLPVGVPGIVFSMGVLLIAIRSPLYGSLVVLLIAYLARFMPVGQRSISGVLLSLSPELEEASRACGSGYGRTLRRVTLPLLKPGIAAAWLLFFVLFLRELPISILLWQSGGEVMSVALWLLLEHATSGKAAAYAVMQSAMILGIVVIFQFVTRTRTAGAAQ